MKFHITTYICVAMAMINIPRMIGGGTMAIVSFSICAACAVVCFFMNERRRRSVPRIW